MSWDATYRLFTAEEQRANDELQAARDRVNELLNRIEELDLHSALDCAISEAYTAAADDIHARLCRVFPHLTDVIALCLWPDEMVPPPGTGPGGMPEPAMHPPAGAERHYGQRWEYRQNQQKEQCRRG